MEWVIDHDDEEAFEAARDALLGRFADAGNSDGAVGDASMLLDWKFAYADGDLVTWTLDDLDELLLDWVPRKVSMPAGSAPSLIASFQQFFAFLAQQRLLGLGSAAWPAIDRHLDKSVAPFRAAMGDSSKFGMAKSVFSSVGFGDSDDIPDAEALREMMESFNSMSFEERSRILGAPLEFENPWLVMTDGLEMLPETPFPRDLVLDFVSRAPFFAGIETIRDFVGDGRKLTAKGNLTVADSKALATRLFPELADGATPRFDVRSADDIPLQQFMIHFARRAGAIKLAKGKLSATAAWTKKDPLERIAKPLRELLDDGLLGYSTGAGAWTNHAIDDLLDEGAPHLLGVLWSADELPVGLLVDMVLEIARESIAVPPASNAELQEIIVRSAFDRLLRALGSVGLVARFELPEDSLVGAPPEIAAVVADGGMLALTDFARAVLAPQLRAHGYDVPVAGSLTDRPLRELFEHAGDWTIARLAIEVDLWAAAHADAEFAEALADIADSTDPLWRLHAVNSAQRGSPSTVEPLLRRLLATRSRGHAIAALADMGADDVPVDRDAQLLAGVDLFSQLLDPDDTDEFIELLVAIDDVERFVEEIWRITEPHAGDVLAAIGSAHPDKRVAKAARKALMKHRTHLANARQG